MTFSFGHSRFQPQTVEHFNSFSAVFSNESVPEGCFQYTLPDELLKIGNSGIFLKTGFYSKNFRNIWELLSEPLYINVQQSNSGTGNYTLTFKSEGAEFKGKVVSHNANDLAKSATVNTQNNPNSNNGEKVPHKGTFISNEGRKWENQIPFKVSENIYVFGGYEGGWFKMASVDANGNFIENRHTKECNSIDELTIEIWNSANKGGDYKVEDIIFVPAAPPSENNPSVSNNGANNSGATSADIMYLEKMLPEDLNIAVVSYNTIGDDIDPELRLSNLMDVTISEPEFAFYTNQTYSKLYVRIYSNINNKSGKQLADGWLGFDDNQKFIIVANPTDKNYGAANIINYMFDIGILPVMYPFALENDYIGTAIETQFSSDQFSNVTDINRHIAGLSLYFLSSGNNSGNNYCTSKNETPSMLTNADNYNCNGNSYDMYFLNATGDTVGLDLEVGVHNISGKDYVFVKETTETGSKVKVQLFENDKTSGIYFAIKHDIDDYTDNVWLGLNEDNTFILVKDVNKALNFYDYISSKIDIGNANTTGPSYTTMSNTIPNTENFTNDLNSNTSSNSNTNNDPATNANVLSGYRIVSNPSKNAQSDSIEDCYKFCKYTSSGDEDTSIIGTYYNTDDTNNNCKCFDQIIMANTAEKMDTSILSNDVTYNHKNTSPITKTVTVTTMGDCDVECQLDGKGGVSTANNGYTFYTTSNKDNCTCHQRYDIRPEEGALAGVTSLTEADDGDYEPGEKYIETSPIIRYLTSPVNRMIYIVFKVMSILVSLLLYSYFAHNDTVFFQIIKVIFVILFSELYLLYQFVNVIIMKNHQSIHLM
jgi:hypothetical protein